MVKFELVGVDAGVAFVDAATVVGVRSWGAHTSMERSGGLREVIVVGTPDEVHAKLFPAPALGFDFTDTERNEAMLRVLHAVVNMRPLDWREVSDSMKADARKALGREGTRLPVKSPRCPVIGVSQHKHLHSC